MPQGWSGEWKWFPFDDLHLTATAIVSAREPHGIARLEDVVRRKELAGIGIDYARKSGVAAN